MKKEVAVKILNILQKHRRIRNSYLSNNYSVEPFIDLVVPFIENQAPFKMLLPGFPCKSINRASVLGSTPDGAEEAALKNLGEMCEEINAVYEFGCELLIVSDGHFFSDIKITASDEVIDVYEDCLQSMVNCPMIQFTNILSSYSLGSYDEIRQVVFEKYLDKIEEVKLAVLHDQSFKNIYVAYKTFIVHEFASTLMPRFTKQEIKKGSKVIAYQWLQRYLVFRKLVSELFSDYFRLSILSYPSKSKSFSINLIMNASEFGLPWFHVLVKKPGGSMELIKKHQAEELGYKLIYKDNIPWYYVTV
jgi:pyoverdine/dityrosine biosynthesis protein Dit1